MERRSFLKRVTKVLAAVFGVVLGIPALSFLVDPRNRPARSGGFKRVARLNELAILITARHWTAQYEWYAHRRLAIQAGLSAATADAIAAGRRPSSMTSDEEAVYNFGTELLDTKQVRDTTFQAIVSKFGEQGVVDLVGVMGYYHLVSMLLNVDRYPLPAGVKPELLPLRQ